jgi:hypothetical protein
LRLGSAARETLDISFETIKATLKLGRALEALLPLQSIRDEELNPKQIAEWLHESAMGLADVIGIAFPSDTVERLLEYRDPSEEGQARRHLGERVRSKINTKEKGGIEMQLEDAVIVPPE